MAIDIILISNSIKVINVKPEKRITIGYCRVSSHKQKDDLERRIDNTEKSEQQELVEEIQEEADGKSHKSNVDTKQCTEN